MRVQAYRSDVAPWDNAGSSDEGGTNVRNDGTVEVRHDHNVELLGLGDQLHGAAGDRVRIKSKGTVAGNVRVVNNHIIESDSRRLVFLGDATEGVEE